MKIKLGRLKRILSESLVTRISLNDAQQEFPEAIEALGDAVSELIFWKDGRGYLHCDDAVHSSFDDMWDASVHEWVGSDTQGHPHDDDNEYS